MPPPPPIVLISTTLGITVGLSENEDVEVVLSGGGERWDGDGEKNFLGGACGVSDVFNSVVLMEIGSGPVGQDSEVVDVSCLCHDSI